MSLLFYNLLICFNDKILLNVFNLLIYFCVNDID